MSHRYASRWGGKRYHGIPHCIGLNAAAMAMCTTNMEAAVPVTLAEIQRRGLTPCRHCKPAPVLTVVPPAEAAASDGGEDRG